ncbi:retinol dehydrogenase 10-B-like [Odontomachus brunneus]|uniref:retinol dehydrogenase 10-B-like n=1 Tax=Odontomachus brunneus TaxID=486640 RepID=UPI0013F1BDFC|nr:retinol dehydrogenase 10-B-like [Odontomachus brunneus]XP_032670330.1 retinol dehydrogenase 10-B-like [Odontomachus brunneus]XP_032670331.1 retinol dehydrogenase 10-B-like [Odontomachus brunneus]XP_032670333.1 retinol dehydrogenase 10-B-like [Odontomachus brunneus]XP_032670334.1 retinol dehydrogenase 10-B-like [Odontomachus brunneus]
MLLPITKETTIATSSMAPSTNLWFFLSVEFLIGTVISTILAVLSVIKSFLPKPPRDLTGDVVLIAGASSTLGEFLAEEFAKGGCSVICVDNDLQSLEEITAKLRSRYCRVEEIRSEHRECELREAEPTIVAYECDLLDCNSVRKIAKKVEDEVGGIDVLVTCAGQPNQDIFDTASTTLMSHHWATLAFLPYMLQRDRRAYVVGITPVASTDDGYLASRTAITGIMESISQELSNHSSRLTFLAVSPTMEHGSMRESEQQVAKEVVQAIRRDQCNVHISWSSKILYRLSRMMYGAITAVTQ